MPRTQINNKSRRIGRLIKHFGYNRKRNTTRSACGILTHKVKAALKTTRQSKIIKYKSTVNLFLNHATIAWFSITQKSTAAKQCLNGMWQRPILPVRSRKNWENRRQTEEISYYAKKHARRYTLRIPRAFSESEYGRYFAWRRFYLFFRR